MGLARGIETYILGAMTTPVVILHPSKMPVGQCRGCRSMSCLADGDHCLRCLWNLLRARALETDHEDDWAQLDALNDLIDQVVG